MVVARQGGLCRREVLRAFPFAARIAPAPLIGDTWLEGRGWGRVINNMVKEVRGALGTFSSPQKGSDQHFISEFKFL